MSRHQTPKEKLLAEKRRIQRECERLEEGFSRDLNYIQGNIGKIALTSVRSLVFPGSKQKKEAGIGKGITQTTTPRGEGSTSEQVSYLTMAKEMLPVAWDIAKPFMIAWGVRRFQGLFRGIFFSKKRGK